MFSNQLPTGVCSELKTISLCYAMPFYFFFDPCLESLWAQFFFLDLDEQLLKMQSKWVAMEFLLITLSNVLCNRHCHPSEYIRQESTFILKKKKKTVIFFSNNLIWSVTEESLCFSLTSDILLVNNGRWPFIFFPNHTGPAASHLSKAQHAVSICSLKDNSLSVWLLPAFINSPLTYFTWTGVKRRS